MYTPRKVSLCGFSKSDLVQNVIKCIPKSKCRIDQYIDTKSKIFILTIFNNKLIRRSNEIDRKFQSKKKRSKEMIKA